MKNPGKSISIYQMGHLMGSAWIKAATPKNIISGFKVSGIWPFDKNIFSAVDFLPSSVHDVSDPEEAGPSGVSNPGRSILSDFDFISPENVRSYPKVKFIMFS